MFRLVGGHRAVGDQKENQQEGEEGEVKAMLGRG
jgi:hypothetical protein